MSVATRHRSYVAMEDRWQRCRDCYEGSDAVKAAGIKYLPKLDSHKHEGSGDKYEEYKLRAMFFNATGRTTDGLAGAIFQKEPTVTVPELYADQMKDVTLTGESLESFGQECGKEVILTGRSGIWIDFPREDDESVQEQRPYFIQFKADDIINWRTMRRGGEEIITRVVLSTPIEVESKKDPFDTELEQQYTVLELSFLENEPQYTVTIWHEVERAGRMEWVAGETVTPVRRAKPLPFIPFVFLNPTTTTAKVRKPPVLDLVDMNLSHYRTMADLEHGRHWTALPTPWVSGAFGKDDKNPLAIGSGTAWILPQGGEAGMLEFSGAGLESLVTAEQDKRKMMAVLGARLLEDQPDTQETLGAVAMRHSGEHANLRSIANVLEQGLTMALRILVWWQGAWETPKEVDKEALVELNKDFFAVKMSATDLNGWVMAFQSNAISFETFYYAMETGGITRPGISAEEEKAAIDAQTAQQQEEATRLFTEQQQVMADFAGDDTGDEGNQPPPKAKPKVVDIKRDKKTGSMKQLKIR